MHSFGNVVGTDQSLAQLLSTTHACRFPLETVFSSRSGRVTSYGTGYGTDERRGHRLETVQKR